MIRFAVVGTGWVAKEYLKAPWVPSSYMPTLPGKLYFMEELAGPLVPELN